MNRTDSATAAYERAWQYGGRGILLADRLIDLLTKQGRIRRGPQICGSSSRLPDGFPRPVRSGDSLHGRRKRQRGNGSHGRTMGQAKTQRFRGSPAIWAASSCCFPIRRQAIKRKTYVEQAKNEFRRAIELTPNDVRPWAAIVMLYGESPATRERGLAVPRGFLQTGKDQRTRAIIRTRPTLRTSRNIPRRPNSITARPPRCLKPTRRPPAPAGYSAASPGFTCHAYRHWANSTRIGPWRKTRPTPMQSSSC